MSIVSFPLGANLTRNEGESNIHCKSTSMSLFTKTSG
jgi:hypothetical protein